MDMERNSRRRPIVIQGGMGVAVSGWRLARAVGLTGQMGVVSGTAIDVVHARLLQDGDVGGHLRRAYAHFPAPQVVERVLAHWFSPNGRAPGEVPEHAAGPPGFTAAAARSGRAVELR